MNKKKEKKLPNKVFGEPIDISNVTKVEKKHPYYDRMDTTIKFKSDKLPSIFEEYYSKVTSAPSFFTKEERATAEIANARLKARRLLDSPFSAGRAYAEFGTSKLPKNVYIMCDKCDRKLEYIVDFFVHVILDHGNSAQHAENIFENLLDRIQSI